jgi:hypothetical protein
VDTYDKVCALVRTKGDAPGWRDVVFKGECHGFMVTLTSLSV